ncbi:hypothetical protein FY528_20645 [Hymenobacter lutimineralis]|uniref:Uncharacterized protein n=2 Tax=Hymenobacter lutimineralis TaxID=2606448 RepID=A0A5D6UT77_9BACT|nr:hypothetical protein FY528_20645 [Hymenobacter lutimineralis]
MQALTRMDAVAALIDRVLRAWPQLRGYFRGRDLITEAELLAFFATAVPEVTAAGWPAVRQRLVHSQLLHQVAPGRLSFKSAPAADARKPVLPPEWRALWQQLQTGLALPPGCLWSTRWLQPFLPDLPTVLVVEVRWAELIWAERLLASSFQPDPVVVRPWQRFSPVRQVRGIPTARPEKMLVDAARLPELAAATSDAALAAALTALLTRPGFNQPLLLQYAARCGTEPRWSALLYAAGHPG